MTTDTEQTTRIHITREMVGQRKEGDVGVLASTIGYWTGMGGMLLLGMLVPVAVEMATPLTPTQVTFDLLRAATLGGLVVASFCWFIHYEAGHVVRCLERAADRNRGATHDVKHSVDDLRDMVVDGTWKTMSVVQAGTRAAQDHRHAIHDAADRVGGEFAEYRREMERLRSLVEGLLVGQSAVLAKVEKRLASAAAVDEKLDQMREEYEKLINDARWQGYAACLTELGMEDRQVIPFDQRGGQRPGVGS